MRYEFRVLLEAEEASDPHTVRFAADRATLILGDILADEPEPFAITTAYHANPDGTMTLTAHADADADRELRLAARARRRR